MADTGAPHFIPFAEPTSLVRDWPALSEDVAEAVADGLDAAGGLVQTAYTLKTDVFDASVGVGAQVLIDDLEVTITPKSADNLLIVMGFVSMPQGTSSSPFITLYRDAAGSLLRGDADGVRQRVTTGAIESGALQNLAFVHQELAGTTSATTFSIFASHTRTIGASTIVVNRLQSDTDTLGTPRGASSILVMEVKV